MAEEKKKKAGKKEKPVSDISEKLKERSRQISEELTRKIAVEEVAGKEAKRKAPEAAQGEEEAAEERGEGPEEVPQEERPAEQAREAPEEKPKKKEEPPAKRQAPKPPQKPPEEAKAYPFAEAIRQAIASSPKRKFSQTWDLAINLKGVDLKKPESRFSVEFPLPEGRGKEVKVGVIADSLAENAKKGGADVVIRKEEMEALARDKRRLKKIANDIDWFYGEVTLMAQVGKMMGTVLGPRGKIPKPLPPNADVGLMIKRARNMVRVALRETPVIHVPIGAEGMKEEAILKNLEGVYGFVKERLPKGVNNIRSAYLKLTMGKPVKLEIM